MAPVKIVGVSHVDVGYARRVASLIREEKPSVVAVELCPARLFVIRQLLLAETPRAPKVSSLARLGLLGALISLVERFFGVKSGTVPGLEMGAAVEAARKIGVPVVPIDRPILATMEELKRIPLREKAGLFLSALSSIVAALLLPKLELSIDELLASFEQRYPNAYRVLVSERDAYMAEKLVEISKRSEGLVLAVVGAGHVEGLRRELLRRGVVDVSAVYEPRVSVGGLTTCC